MKKTLTIIATALCLSLAQAQQSYQSVFGDTLTDWYYVYHTNTCDFSNSGACFEHSVADTIVWGGLTYNYVRLTYYRNNRYYDNTWTHIEYLPGEDFGLRESEDNSQLYRRTSEDSAEVLIMDLNWRVGDTIELWDSWLGQSCNITTIDSIFYASGRKHLRTTHYLNFSSGGYPETTDTLYFIEGTGPSLGLAPFNQNNILVPILSCHWLDEDLEPVFRRHFPAWEDWAFFGDCLPPDEIGTESIIDIPQMSIHPNPTTGILQLEGLPHGEKHIGIYNVFGQKIQSFSTEGDRSTLDISRLTPGVYFIRISSSEKDMLKIIKF